MGIIIRQSVKQSIVAYSAIIIAAAAQILIYPMDDLVTYGRAQKMFAIIFLCYPIMFFGIPQAVVKFFGEFEHKEKGYLLNFIILALVISLIVGSFFYLLREPIFGYKPSEQELAEGSPIWDFEQYIPYIIASILVMVLFKVFGYYMASYKRIVWPAIFETLFPKIALAALVFCIIQGFVPDSYLEPGIMIYLIIGLIGLIMYTAYLGRLNLKFNPEIFKKKSLASIGSYAGYTGLTVFGGMLATRIDGVMAGGFVNDKMMGIYFWFVFLCSLIDTPGRSVSSISGPIVSQAIHKGDFEEVNTVYQKSAITLFLVGAAMYALIFLSIEDLIHWMGKAELLIPFVMIFGILGLVKLAQSTLVMSGQILVYSAYYRVMLYITLFMAATNILLNYWFITDVFSDQIIFGICYATAISTLIQYTIMVAYVWFKFRIHPFSWKMMYGFLAMASCFTLAYYIPMPDIHILSIGLRSLLFGVPFLYLIYRFRLSPDINAIIDLSISKIKNRDFKNII